MCGAKNVIGSTMAGLLQNFRDHVTDTVLLLEDSGFFQNRHELPKNQLKFLEAVLKGTVTDSQLHKVLFKLTEIFHVLHRKQVVVLIDEYDTPTSHAVRDGYFPEVCLSQGQNVYSLIPFAGKSIFPFSLLTTTEGRHDLYRLDVLLTWNCRITNIFGAPCSSVFCVLPSPAGFPESTTSWFAFSLIPLVMKWHLLPGVSSGSVQRVFDCLHVHGGRNENIV